MTTQRIAGLWLSLFMVYVIGNHYFRDGLSFFDLAYTGAMVPLVLSAVSDTRWAKAFQIFAVAFVGAFIAFFDPYGRPVGYSALTIAYVFMFAYGFMGAWVKTKSAVFLAAYIGVFTFGVPGQESQLSWFIMAVTIPAGLWLAVKELVAQAMKAAALKEIVLRHQLGVVRELLDEAVEAGLILSDEVKRNAGGKDAGGR